MQGLNEEEGNIKSRRRKIIVEKEIKVLVRKLERSSFLTLSEVKYYLKVNLNAIEKYMPSVLKRRH